MNDLRIVTDPTGTVHLFSTHDHTRQTVTLTPEDWAEFLTAAKAGKFDTILFDYRLWAAPQPDAERPPSIDPGMSILSDSYEQRRDAYRAARREQHPGDEQ